MMKCVSALATTRSLLLALLAGVSTHAVSSAAHAQTASVATDARQSISFDIAPQPLSSALVEFARQSGLRTLFSYDQLGSVRTSGVRGTYTREEALTRLLSNSGFAGQISADNVLTLEGAGRPQRASADEPAPFAPQQNAGAAPAAEAASPQDPERGADEEIIVTGTRIRGAAPVGTQLITVDRIDIEESGLATTEQLMRTLPQVFGGDVAQHVSFQGGNIGGGSTVNLRGLGADATLSLVNGRRLPTLGLRGNFADISTIPVSAIERVEVLPDSASAIYGSDAVGGVVNFIMRNDFEGLELGVRRGAVTEGDLNETRINLTAGAAFGDLRLFFAYERLERTALAMADRAYLADSDLTALGGGNFDLNRSNPTTLIVSGGLGNFAVPFGQDGTDLSQSDLVAGQVNRANANEGLYALPDTTQDALFASARLELAPTFEVFAEARLAQRTFVSRNGHSTSRIVIPATNAFRAVNGLFPGRTVQADYDFFRDLGPRTEDGEITTIDLAAGARWDVGDTWAIEPTLAYARTGGLHRTDNLVNTTALNVALASSDPNIAFNPFGDGSFTNPATLDAIRGYGTNDIVSEVWSVSAKADGALVELPAGTLRAAIGGDYRQEFYEVGGVNFLTGTAPVERVFSSNGRNVTALFGEVLVPVFGPGFEPPLGQRLDLSLAARFERYSDFGDTTNPKIGLAWTLTDAVRLRASYGHSFRAPNLPDIDPNGTLGARQVRGINITDPVSSSGISQIIFFTGANTELREQTAVSWSAGLSYDTPGEHGLRFDIDYFDVRFSDRISGITNIAAAMFPNSEFALLVDRAPDPALIAALLAEAAALGTSGGFSVADIDAIVDVRSTNLARTDVRGVDVGMAYAFELGGGELELRADATYLLEFLKAATPIAIERDVIDTVGNPIDLRARLGASWRTETFTAAAFLNYMDSYTDNLSSPTRDIDAWSTLDLHLSWRLPEFGVARTPRIALSVTNAFDEDPPFVNNALGFGYDTANADPLGRFVALELSSRF